MLVPLRFLAMQVTSRTAFSSLVSPLNKSSFLRPRLKSSSLPLCPFSTSTRYPLYYELIHYHPVRRQPRPHSSSSTSISAATPSDGVSSSSSGGSPGDSDHIDRAKRRYYRKKQKRMYGESGSDSDSARRSDFVELKPVIIDFPRLHTREQELYFHDAFSFPWEKDKHYRMVHQLEKKFFPEYSFDKAFVDPPTEVARLRKEERTCKKDERAKMDERDLVFFDGEKKGEEKKKGGGDVSEKKVDEFFKFLKKVPNVQSRSDVVEEASGEPFLSSRRTGLPAKWDGPSGTVVLVDKPKGM